ncbi:hypothetical protein ACFQX4_25695 [Roseomonas sp. GCM10028921]
MKRQPLFEEPAALFGGATLAACPTGLRLSDMSSGVPSIPHDKGRIWFSGSSSPFGVVKQPSIMMNRRKMGNSTSGSALWKDVLPESNEVSTTIEIDSGLTITLVAGEERSVCNQVTPGLVGRVEPKLVAAAEWWDAWASRNHIAHA